MQSPAQVFASLIASEQPRPELAEALAPFEPLIGSWDLDVAWYDENGEINRTTQGEWHFSWALDGRAVADIWITPSRERHPVDGDGEWGLSVRFYDEQLGAFRSTWLGPKAAFVMPFVAHAGDGTIRLEALTPTAAKTRWIFTDISSDGFHWRNEDETAEGVTVLRQTFVARRGSDTE
ncbi:hypothetical protein [Kribbella deserti]|uniref:DUF1579 domain-containing protein n=1 Tax=Kribbella deserti TaxID=1926257 RepID=A0ABV6QPT0_9ACTN